ncbi:ThuA domain-containing protein [Agromyces sp. PvR057]|uniref:ThuA domain-containing protein n=1 Tax=Agromyces sp. PvR057 TaxID=3156403 RepID=UPI003392ABE9
MPDAVILSGGGRYADPWHPFAETSALLAAIVREAGFTVEVDDDPDAALAALGDDVRLVVVNAGDPGDGPVPSQAAAAASALDRALDRGIGLLAMHAAAASLRAYPAYERLLGGRWVRDVSWHPPFGEARVHLVGGHAVAEGLADFTVLDERYTDLRRLGGIEPIAEHVEGGMRHPLVWAREVGRSRLVYDALGHDARSYDSAAHRELIAGALRWLAAVDAP